VKNYAKKPFRGRLRVSFRACAMLNHEREDEVNDKHRGDKPHVLQLPPILASNGSSWMAARSTPSTAPVRICWKHWRMTFARAGSAWASPNLRTEVRALLERSGVKAALGEGALFPTLKSAVASCEPGGFTEAS
jgi:hypothetical protein